MDQQRKKHRKRWARHRHIRHKLIGTPERPRLAVYRSLRHIYCQLIDDTFVDKTGSRSGRTLTASSTMAAEVRAQVSYGGNIKAAKVVGEDIAKKAQALGIVKVCFDRGGNRYHGRVKALAEAAREHGLQF